jgi:transposase
MTVFKFHFIPLRMVKWFKNDEELWCSIYHARSIAESVFFSIKKRYGFCLRAIKSRLQGIKLALKVVSHNIKQVVYANLAKGFGVDLYLSA